TTKADELYDDDIPEEVKKRRNNDLLAIQNGISLADHRAKIGETVKVLVEGPSKAALKHESSGGPMQLTGRTQTDHIVVFEGNERLTGASVDVMVDDASSFTLFGTVVTDECVGEQGCELPQRVLHPKEQRFSLP